MRLWIALLVWLVCTEAAADNRWRWRVPPYRIATYLPWTRIPYPWCPFEVQFKGESHELHNPQGFACEPGYNGDHYFWCVIHVGLDKATIDAASYEGEVWEKKY